MPRRLRIEYEGAIHHVMARGNARQDIVHDDDDRERLLGDLERTVTRSGWELLAFVVMTNHLHLLLKTPHANLGRGMQQFLSAYAQWSLRRRGRLGHLFQGRYRAELIEDESYYWTVSRYIHLNPVRAKLVGHPAEWRWSSYPGYARRRQRQSWVAYDALLAACGGEYGGRDPAAAYRRFVAGGVAAPPPSPFREAFGGWVLGSDRFAARVRALAEADGVEPSSPELRQLAALESDATRICFAVAAYYGVAVSDLTRRHAHETARSVAAWLCRRHTETPLRQLAELLGLSRADSVPNLTRRVDRLLPGSPALAADIEAIKRQMSAELPLGTTGQRARKTKNHA